MNCKKNLNVVTMFSDSEPLELLPFDCDVGWSLQTDYRTLYAGLRSEIYICAKEEEKGRRGKQQAMEEVNSCEEGELMPSRQLPPLEFERRLLQLMAQPVKVDGL